jgi:hypothetical protein
MVDDTLQLHIPSMFKENTRDTVAAMLKNLGKVKDVQFLPITNPKPQPLFTQAIVTFDEWNHTDETKAIQSAIHENNKYLFYLSDSNKLFWVLKKYQPQYNKDDLVDFPFLTTPKQQDLPVAASAVAAAAAAAAAAADEDDYGPSPVTADAVELLHLRIENHRLHQQMSATVQQLVFFQLELKRISWLHNESVIEASNLWQTIFDMMQQQQTK